MDTLNSSFKEAIPPAANSESEDKNADTCSAAIDITNKSLHSEIPDTPTVIENTEFCQLNSSTSINMHATNMENSFSSVDCTLSEDKANNLHPSSSNFSKEVSPGNVPIAKSTQECLKILPTSEEKSINSVNKTPSDSLVSDHLNISSLSKIQINESQQLPSYDNSSVNSSYSEALTDSLNISSVPNVHSNACQQLISCDNSLSSQNIEEDLNKESSGMDKLISTVNNSNSEDLIGCLNISSVSNIQFNESQQLLFCDDSSIRETTEKHSSSLSSNVKESFTSTKKTHSEDMMVSLNNLSATNVQLNESQQVVSCDGSSIIENIEDGLNKLSSSENEVTSSVNNSHSENLTVSLNISSVPHKQSNESLQVSCDSSSIPETIKGELNNLSSSFNKFISTVINSQSQDMMDSLSISSASNVQLNESEEVLFCDDSSIRETTENHSSSLSSSVKQGITSSRNPRSEDLTSSLNILPASNVQINESQQALSCDDSSITGSMEGLNNLPSSENGSPKVQNKLSTIVNEFISTVNNCHSEDLTGRLNISSTSNAHLNESRQLISSDDSSIRTSEGQSSILTPSMKEDITLVRNPNSEDLTSSLNILSTSNVQVSESLQVVSHDKSSITEATEDLLNTLSTSLQQVISSLYSTHSEDLTDSLNISSVPNKQFNASQQLVSPDNSLTLDNIEEGLNKLSLSSKVDIISIRKPHSEDLEGSLNILPDSNVQLNESQQVLCDDSSLRETTENHSSTLSSNVKEDITSTRKPHSEDLMVSLNNLSVSNVQLNESQHVVSCDDSSFKESKKEQLSTLSGSDKQVTASVNISHSGDTTGGLNILSTSGVHFNESRQILNLSSNTSGLESTLGFRHIFNSTLDESFSKNSFSVVTNCNDESPNLSGMRTSLRNDHYSDEEISLTSEGLLDSSQNIPIALKHESSEPETIHTHQVTNYGVCEKKMNMSSDACSMVVECGQENDKTHTQLCLDSSKIKVFDSSINLQFFPNNESNSSESMSLNEMHNNTNVKSCELPFDQLENKDNSFSPFDKINNDESGKNTSKNKRVDDSFVVPTVIENSTSLSLEKINVKSVVKDNSTLNDVSLYSVTTPHLLSLNSSVKISPAGSIHDIGGNPIERTDPINLSIELNSEKLVADLTTTTKRSVSEVEVPLLVPKERDGNPPRKSSVSSFQPILNEELFNTNNMELTIITESQKENANCMIMNTSDVIESADLLDFTCKPEATILGDETILMSQSVIGLENAQDQKYPIVISSGACSSGKGFESVTEYYSKQDLPKEHLGGNHLKTLDSIDCSLNDCEETSGCAMDYTLSISECPEISTSYLQQPATTKHSNSNTCYEDLTSRTGESCKLDPISVLKSTDERNICKIVADTTNKFVDPEVSYIGNEISFFNNPHKSMTIRKQLSESINKSIYLGKKIPSEEVQSLKENLVLIMDLLEKENNEFEIYKRTCETEKSQLLNEIEILQKKVLAGSLISNSEHVTEVDALENKRKEDLAALNANLETDLRMHKDSQDWFKKVFFLSDSDLQKTHEIYSHLKHMAIDVGPLISVENDHAIDPKNVLNTLSLLLTKYRSFSDDYNELKLNYENYKERSMQLENQMKKYDKEQSLKFDKLKTECQKLEISLKGYIEQSKSLEESNQMLKSDLLLRESELYELQKDIKLLNEEIARLQEKDQIVINDLRKSNLELKIQFSDLERSREDLMKQLREKSCLYEELLQSNDSLKREVNDLNTKLIGLEEETACTKELNMVLESRYRSLEQKLVAAEELKTNHESLVDQFTSLQAEFEQYRLYTVSKDEEINSLTEKNKEMEEEMSSLRTNIENILFTTVPKDDFNETTTLLHKTSEELRSISVKYNEEKKNAEALLNNLNSKDSQNNELMLLNDELKEKNSILINEISVVKNDYEFLKNENRSLAEKYDSALTDISKLSNIEEQYTALKQLYEESSNSLKCNLDEKNSECEELKISNQNLEKEIGKLNGLLENYTKILDDNSAQMNSECQLLKDELSKQCQLLDSAKDELESLRPLKTDYENLVLKHETECSLVLTDLSSKYEEVKGSLAISQEECLGITAANEKLQTEIQSLNNEILDVKQKYATLVGERDVLQKELDANVLKSEALRATYNDVEAKYSEVCSKFEKIEKTLLETMTEKTVLEETNKTSQCEITNLSNSLEKLKEELNNITETHGSLLQEYELLKNECKTLEDEKDLRRNVESKNIEITLKCEQLEKDLISKSNVIQDLESHVQKLNEKTSLLETDYENLVLKHETECSLVLTDLSSKYEEVKGSLAISQEECLGITTANEKLQTEIQSLSNEIIDIKQKYATLVGEHDVLQKELDANALKSEALGATYIDVEAKYSEVCSKFEKLEKNYLETMTEKTALEETNKTSQCEITNLSNSLEKLKEELNNVKETHGSLLQEYELLKIEYKTLEDEKDLQKNVESRNIEITLKCEQLEKDLISKSNVIQDMESQVQKLNEKTNWLHSENERLNKECSQSSSLTVELSSSLQQLTEEKIALEKQLSQNYSDLNNALVQIEKFNHFDDLIMSYRKDYPFLNEECTKLQSEFSTKENSQFDIFFASVENILKSIIGKNEEVAVAKSSLSNKESEIESLNNQIKLLRKEAHDAEIKSLELINDHTSLKEKYQSLLYSHGLINEKYDSLLQTFNKLDTENSELKKVKADQTSEIGEKDRLISGMLETKKKYESLLCENNTIVSQLSERECEIQRLNIELATNKEIHVEMNEKVEKLWKDVESLGREKKDLECNLDNYRSLFENVKKEASSLKQEIEALRLEKCKYEKDYQSAVDSLNLVQEQMCKTERDFDEKMARFTFVLKEKENFENKTLSLLKENDELSNKLKNLTQTSKEYEKSYSKLLLLQNDFRLLSDEKMLLEKKVCDIDKIKKECTDLKADVVVKDSQINDLKIELKQLKTNYQLKSDELQQLCDEICSKLPDCKSNSDIVNSVDQVLSRINNIEEELKEEKLKSKNLDEECEVLYKDINYKDKMLGDLYQQHLDELSTVKDTLEKNEKQLRNTIEKLEAEIVDLKTTEPLPCTVCIENKRTLHKLKIDLVERDSKIASLQQDLEEHQNLLKKKVQEYRKKVTSLQDELSTALSKLKSFQRNTFSESATQTDPTPLQLSGQGGIVHSIKIKEQEDKIQKIEKENMLLKKVCHNRLQTIKDLQGKLESGGQSQPKKPSRSVLEEIQNN